MRYCDWDEVLDRDGLLILTEEALTPPRRSRAPLRRLAAAAACAGLVLGLMNYRAVAAGVGELCRYFAGPTRRMLPCAAGCWNWNSP